MAQPHFVLILPFAFVFMQVFTKLAFFIFALELLVVILQLFISFMEANLNQNSQQLAP